jgi:hypothetical protein
MIATFHASAIRATVCINLAAFLQALADRPEFGPLADALVRTRAADPGRRHRSRNRPACCLSLLELAIMTIPAPDWRFLRCCALI